MSLDLCKNNYSHSYFAVLTFLTKNQNPLVIIQISLSKHKFQKKLDGKFYYCPRILKNLDGKNHYWPRILKNLGVSMFSFPLFYWYDFEFLSGMVHYFEKLMGVVVFAKVQGQVKFENPRTRRFRGLSDLTIINFGDFSTVPNLLKQ